MVDDDPESMCMPFFEGSQQDALNRNFQLSQLLLCLLNHKPLHPIIEDFHLSDSAFFEMQQNHADILVTISVLLMLLAFGNFNACATE